MPEKRRKKGTDAERISPTASALQFLERDGEQMLPPKREGSCPVLRYLAMRYCVNSLGTWVWGL